MYTPRERERERSTVEFVTLTHVLLRFSGFRAITNIRGGINVFDAL